LELNGQPTLEKPNNDSIMEKKIKYLIESSLIGQFDVPLDYKTYSFLFIINYDSSTNGTVNLSIDTFFDNKIELPLKRGLYRTLVRDTIKLKKIISMYHPSNSLSIVLPFFRNIDPSDSNSTKSIIIIMNLKDI